MRDGARHRGLSAVRVVVLVAFGLAAAAPVGAETLTYVLTPRFGEGRLDVKLTWQTGNRERSALRIAPRWGQVDDVPALLRRITIAGAKVERDNTLWILTHRPDETLVCQYAVEAGHAAFDRWELAYHPITAKTYFHGVGNAFLLVPYPPAGGPAQYETLVRWELPDGYSAACSWGAGRTIGATMAPEDLARSSYLAGDIVTRSVPRDGRQIGVAMVDRFDFSADELLGLTTRIVNAQCRFMLEDSFPDFVITALPVGPAVKGNGARIAGSGLYNGFSLYMAPQSRLDDAFEHLFAHELFHYWNGGVLAAEAPERAVYWFVEGFTDYYSLRILHESKVWGSVTYAKWINKHLREYAFNPAARASNAEIDRDYWEKRRTVGEVAYQRGLALGLRWNYLARRNGVSDGLDKLIHALVDRGRTGLAISNPRLRSAGIETLGAWLGPEFDRYVTQAEPVDVPPEALEPALVGRLQDVFEYELGFDRAASIERRRISGLLRGSEAERAGVRAGDAMLAWNIHNDTDQEITLTVTRDGQRQELHYYPRGERRRAVQFRPR